MSLRAVKSRLQSYFKPAGVVSPEETDDAAAASDRTVPPSQSRSTAERERPKTVDLSTPSPEATRRATQTHYEPTNIHASTHTPKQRTRLAHNRPPGDEERLLRTNTRLPADATRLLPAQHVFDTMRLKPGAARSFKPQNTIDGVRHTQQSRAQPRTYASSQKPSSRLDFLDRVDIDSPTVTGSHTVPEISSQPPAKRRKVQLSRTQKQEVISLDEEDEGEEEESDIELPAPRMRPPSQISRSVSARSQRSAESDRTVTIGPPISGFQAADKLGNSHRKKRRTNESVLTTSSCHWPETATSYSSNPMRGTKATSPIPVDDDELAPKSRTLTQRTRLLEGNQRRMHEQTGGRTPTFEMLLRGMGTQLTM
ncbi:hypothetical protein BDV95DRAFT_58056 [Massariosphaeria phaeospora]|uniref:Uncharacterized protein n=1 Tax=Massariosphaeria phaeospora TaxID=100035 RepID=A0A7C8M9R8_9PLEO|nr:hypothetical protein BDV95DRAFT_58056 [Massariosphaeria phaeospora]